MNAYDFDKTIYYDDSSTDFVWYNLKVQPSLVRYLPHFIYGGLGYLLHLHSKTIMKQHFFAFLRGVKDIDARVEEFWQKHQHKIKPWYLKQKQPDDYIISASPEFLLMPIIKQLGLVNLIGSDVDKHTGRFLKENCYGAMKVKYFQTINGNQTIDNFYSDSYSDTPLALISLHSYLVKGDEIRPW